MTHALLLCPTVPRTRHWKTRSLRLRHAAQRELGRQRRQQNVGNFQYARSTGSSRAKQASTFIENSEHPESNDLTLRRSMAQRRTAAAASEHRSAT